MATGNENLLGALVTAIQICNDESHGYTMGADMNPDTDCSGLVGYALSQNGFDVPRRWNTATMIPILDAYEGFTRYTYYSGMTLKPGDILVYDEGGGTHGHTFFYAENVTGYYDENSQNQTLLPRVRIEASSSRDQVHPGDQRKNGVGAYWEVWVHSFYEPDPTAHTWYVYRWKDEPGPIPPGPEPTPGTTPLIFIKKNRGRRVIFK